MANDILIDRLNKRIEIQEKIKVPDTYGGFTETWTTLYTCWAEIKPTNTSNDFEANKISDKITYIITIRYTNNIKNNYRIKFNNRIFNIINIMNLMENNKILEITTEEEIIN